MTCNLTELHSVNIKGETKSPSQDILIPPPARPGGRISVCCVRRIPQKGGMLKEYREGREKGKRVEESL